MTGIYNIFSLRTFDVCLSCISCLSVYIKSLIMISIYTWELTLRRISLISFSPFLLTTVVKLEQDRDI